MFVTSVGEISLPYILLLGTILYTIGLGIYRLYLSPIAGIPGPKLAALTQWYETYYDLFTNPVGQFIFQYRKMHEKYGPIIRINPQEVHIQDSQFYHVFFSKTRAWDRPEYLKYRLNNESGVFLTPSHELHKHRRAALNPFFSKRRILEYSPLMQAQMNQLCERLNREYKGTKKIVRLDWMFACFAADAVVGYCFENNQNWLESPEFRCSYAEGMEGLLGSVHLLAQFPWIGRILPKLPEDLLSKISPAMREANNFTKELRRQIDFILAGGERDPKEPKRETVFKAILESGLPPEEISPLRLQHEAQVIVGAAVETTRGSLAIGAFHIINNRDIFRKLRAELEEAIPDPESMLPLDQLEKLPYLDACVQECCRLAYGSVGRSHRVSDHITLQYGPYTLPPGTIISMDNSDVSHDEEIFPDSYTFRPERWLNDSTAPDGRPLSAYMVSFGRGTRSCLGMPLALAELHIVMANLYRKFDFELYETDRSAVDFAVDVIAPKPKPGTLGVRVYVK